MKQWRTKTRRGCVIRNKRHGYETMQQSARRETISAIMVSPCRYLIIQKRRRASVQDSGISNTLRISRTLITHHLMCVLCLRDSTGCDQTLCHCLWLSQSGQSNEKNVHSQRNCQLMMVIEANINALVYTEIQHIFGSINW